MTRVALPALLLLCASAAAPAQFYSGGSPQWGPNGNGTLDHEDDLRWVFFHDAKIAADEAKGEYRATFSPTLSKEDGRPFEIAGYMLLVEATTTSRHFVLTRRSAGCPFCPPNELTEAIGADLTAGSLLVAVRCPGLRRRPIVFAIAHRASL